MKTNPNRFWLLVILLGWTFDFLFWEKVPGVNFILYVVCCLGVGFYLLNANKIRISPRSSVLIVPILFFAAQTFLRQEPMTRFLSVAMTLFLMGVLAISYTGGQWIRFRLVDYAVGYLQLLGSMLVRQLGFSAEVRREQFSTTEKRSNNIFPILRGIVIAIPVIAIFASLLSSADPIFGNRFDKFVELFRIDNLPEYIFRLVYILVFAYALAGTYLHAAQKSDGVPQEKPVISPFLGFTEASIVLGSVAVLFTSFVIIQFQYFFGGHVNIASDGFTYSEYAVRGFGELVTVAFFCMLMLLGLGSITRRESDQQRQVFSTLGIILVGLVIVMLISAFKRLGLYEQAYGFSRLRTYTHVFMIWLGMLLVTVAVLEYLKREGMIGFAMVLASIGFAASLALLNVDGFIVKNNVLREIQNPQDKLSSGSRPGLDARYFLDLSDDAIPSIVNAFRDTTLPVDVHEKLGVSLACMRNDRQSGRDMPWQSFDYARYRADQAFAEIKDVLDTFLIVDSDWPVTIESPGGETYDCWQYRFD